VPAFLQSANTNLGVCVMPDMERAIRELELDLAKDDQVKLAEVRGKHRGQDSARWEIVMLFALCVAMACLLCAALS
jgi:hypothetical protein